MEKQKQEIKKIEENKTELPEWIKILKELMEKANKDAK